MQEEYNFSNGRKNPYAKKLKQQITIKIDYDTIEYFKEQSEDSGIPYQTLINLYLSDCAKQKKTANDLEMITIMLGFLPALLGHEQTKFQIFAKFLKSKSHYFNYGI